MAWISSIKDDCWDNGTDDHENDDRVSGNQEVTLASLKPRCIDPVSKQVDNILAVHALDPKSLLAHLTIYEQAMRPTDSLTKQDREMIALVVSKENGCHY